MTTTTRQLVATTHPLSAPVRGLFALLRTLIRRADRRAGDRPLSPVAVSLLTRPVMRLHTLGGAHAVAHTFQDTPGGFTATATVCDRAGLPLPLDDFGVSVVAALPGARAARPLGSNGYVWVVSYPRGATPVDDGPGATAQAPAWVAGALA